MQIWPQRKPDPQAGNSLVSVIVGIAIGAIAIAIAVANFSGTRQIAKDFTARDVFGHLEGQARSAIRFGMDIASNKNSGLRDCLLGTSPCPTSPKPITLWVANSNAGLVTRPYKANGAPCAATATDCDIVVAARYTAACPSAPCQPASQIIVTYTVTLAASNTVVRRGVEWHVPKQAPVRDDVDSCPLAADSFATQFLRRRVAAQQLTCVPLANPPPGQTTSCAQGSQILAGLDASGKAICENIFFK